MFVVDHAFLDCLQRSYYDLLDLFKGFGYLVNAILAHEVKFEGPYIPLSSKLIVIVVRKLLHGHIGQVHHVVA